MATVDGLPMFKDLPADVIWAARKVRQWAEEQGYADWSICGLQPVGSLSVTRLALNALWMLASPARIDAEQSRHLAEMSAKTVEREMHPDRCTCDDWDRDVAHFSDCPQFEIGEKRG